MGPSDLSQSLGISDSRDPRLRSTIEEISATLLKVGKAKMAIPLGHPAFPVDVAQLQKMGVAYANCGPAVVPRLLNSYRQQVQEIKAQLG